MAHDAAGWAGRGQAATVSAMSDGNEQKRAATQDAIAVMTASLSESHDPTLIDDQFDRVIEEHGGELGAVRLSIGLMNLCGFLIHRLARREGRPPEEVLQAIARRFAIE
jgi:hypothetical protein